MKNRTMFLCALMSLIFSLWMPASGMAARQQPAAYNSLRFEILSAHNALREKHQAKNLLWDSTLERYAQQHAEACVFQHSHSRYGENLAAGYPSATAAINAWYAEKSSYLYWYPHYSRMTGHFTQLVWASTTKVGCAYVRCDGRNGTPGNYLVCEYSPAGNITNSGYFAANVLPEKS